MEARPAELSAARWHELYWGAGSGYPSVRELARRLGCGRSTVLYHFSRHDIRVRTRSEQARIDCRHGRRPPPTGGARGNKAWQASGRANLAAARAKGLCRPRSGPDHFRYSYAPVRCYWCGATVLRRGNQRAKHRRHFCSPSCQGKGAMHLRWQGEDTPRPLIVASLRQAVSTQQPTRALLERLAPACGAGEAEIIEVMLDAL